MPRPRAQSFTRVADESTGPAGAPAPGSSAFLWLRGADEPRRPSDGPHRSSRAAVSRPRFGEPEARQHAAVEARHRACYMVPCGARRCPGPLWRASQRQNTIACDVASAVSKPRDGDGPHPSGKWRMTCYRPHDLTPVVIDHPLRRLADAEIAARAVQAAG